MYEYKVCHNQALKAVSAFAWSEYGIPVKDFLNNYEICRAKVKSRIVGASSNNRLLYFSELITRFDSKIDVDVAVKLADFYWTAYFSEMKLAEGIEEFIQKLRHRGVQIAMITDQVSDTQLRKIRILRIEKLFDFVVTSEECSGEKKSLAPFQLLFERTKGKDFGCVWFIGDEIQDWPREVAVTTKIFLASPYAGKVPRGVKKICNYKDACKLI